MSGEPDQMTKWSNELEYVKQKLFSIRNEEKERKVTVKGLEHELRVQRRKLHKTTKQRLEMQKDVKLFWTRRKAKLYRLRKWASENPGKTVVLSGKAAMIYDNGNKD